MIDKSASTADAADLTFKAPQVLVPYDWTGFYVGRHVGYASGSSAWTATDPTGVASSGNLALYNGFNIFKGTGSFFAGLQGGYNIVLPSRLLLGLEADASFHNTWEGLALATSTAAGTESFDEMVLHSGTVRSRIGYASIIDSFTRLAASPGATTKLHARKSLAVRSHPRSMKRRSYGGSAGPREPASRYRRPQI